MRRINPSLITTFIVIMFIGTFLGLDLPFIIFGFVAYVIFNMSRNRRQQEGRDRSGRYQRRQSERDRRYQERGYRQPSRRHPAPPRPKPVRSNPHKKTGIEKYKEFDYEGAIEDFNKALEIDHSDASVHFNIACAYSLTEQKDKAFQHLSHAVANGFKDVEKIKTHDALAYIRVQDEFEPFVENGYRYRPKTREATKKPAAEQGDLLEQLNQLSKMREKGLLTQEEFEIQKKRLLG